MSEDSKIRIATGRVVDLMNFTLPQFLKGYNASMQRRKFMLEVDCWPSPPPTNADPTDAERRAHHYFSNLTIDDALGLRPWRVAFRQWQARNAIAFCDEHEVWYPRGPRLYKLKDWTLPRTLTEDYDDE